MSPSQPHRIERRPDGSYRLTTHLWVNRPIDEVFEFCSDPQHLAEITPAWLGLRVLSPQPVDMHRGTVINYRFRVRGVPGKWKSHIANWDPPGHFVDQQLRGPFKTWYHVHTFESADGGTLTGDIIDYTVLGGRLTHETLARRNLNRLFDHRHAAMRRVLGG